MGKRIVRAIRISGPLSLADYMLVCLADPKHGYYANRDALGGAGDFITAPEISQVFGELIGIWCAAAWQAIGRPSPFVLAEAGPGKGTMMADLLRAGSTVPGFAKAARLVLIETSRKMIAAQKKNLASAATTPGWAGAIGEVPAGPLILVANEFLDALPVHQFVRTSAGWRERCIGLGKDGNLEWTLGTRLADPSILPNSAASAPEGAVVEHAPARNAWVEMLASRLADQGGVALAVDYGYAANTLGDTFQAVVGHRYTDPLAAPGEADLTAHVDFGALGEAASRTGAVASRIISQREFLLSMGLKERVAALARANPGEAGSRVGSDAQRLIDEAQMGSLFKVIAICGPNEANALIGVPPFTG